MKTHLTNSLKVSLRAAAFVVAVGLPAVTFGQNGVTTPTVNTGSTLKHTDKRFLEKAAESGREEVEISQVALDRSTNPDVKKFAQTMVDEHGRANQELASIAAARGVTLKDKPKSENRWAKKDLKDFDRDYVKKMLSDHKDAVELFTKESENGTDPEIVEFARKTLKSLNQHLEQVDTLQKTVP